MATTTTSWMNLVLPIPTQELGPLWAVELNSALELVDSHNHTSSKGVPVPVEGLDINGDLGFNGQKAFDLFSTQYQDQTTPISGASNAGSVSTSGGDLYYTNGAGVPVQLTSGGSVITSPGSVVSLEITSIASNLTISPSDTFVYIIVDTSAARQVTLPAASSVVAGRMYIVKDKDNLANTNNITVLPDGADLVDQAANYILDSNGAAKWFVTDGVSNWYVS